MACNTGDLLQQASAKEASIYSDFFGGESSFNEDRSLSHPLTEEGGSLRSEDPEGGDELINCHAADWRRLSMTLGGCTYEDLSTNASQQQDEVSTGNRSFEEHQLLHGFESPITYPNDVIQTACNTDYLPSIYGTDYSHMRIADNEGGLCREDISVGGAESINCELRMTLGCTYEDLSYTASHSQQQDEVSTENHSFQEHDFLHGFESPITHPDDDTRTGWNTDEHPSIYGTDCRNERITDNEKGLCKVDRAGEGDESINCDVADWRRPSITLGGCTNEQLRSTDSLQQDEVSTGGHSFEEHQFLHGFESPLTHPDDDSVPMPLAQWMEMEKLRATQNFKASVVRKLNVAYGLCKLLQISSSGVSTDNFAISELPHEEGWEVTSIHMMNPPLLVKLEANDTEIAGPKPTEKKRKEDTVGRDVSAIIVGTDPPVMQEAPANEMRLCCAVGELLHFLFSEEEVKRKGQEDKRSTNDTMNITQPTKKQTRESSLSQASIYSRSHCANASTSNDEQSECKDSLKFRPLIDYGYPPSISLLVGDLLSCGDDLFRSDSAFKSLQEATDEVHLLLEDPTSLLFERVYQGKNLVTMGTNRLFGRSAETGKIVDAYLRVASTQRSEVVIIGGHSGSGKTRLVQKAMDSVRFSGGYFVQRKFEEISTQSCMHVVLSAFDELLFQIAQSKPTELLSIIYTRLTAEFGSSFQLLTLMLPNVLLFRSCQQRTQELQLQSVSNANFMSLCFTLQRLMKIISSSAGPFMLFLDDLQWADPTSLGLVHAVITGLEDSNSLLLIGSYRNNDAKNGQLIYDFLATLSRLNTPLTTIHLDGMPEADVRLMISDALGIVPRLCTTLSVQVHRKTKGSPFFVREFMRTLVEQGLVRYSLREKRWIWDVDKIVAKPITDNVLQLITLKMHTLSQRAQTALKVASCFGIKVLSSIVKSLSSTQQYSGLQTDMDNAVEEGFIDFDGTHYRFSHDKVREASYELIGPTTVRNQFHFKIGMALYESCFTQDDRANNGVLFTTVEQINYGEPSLMGDKSQRVSIAKLNYKAGLVSMESWDFMGALTYMKACCSLLPDDSWDTHYELSLNIHYRLAEAACPCGAIDVAKVALNKIDQKGKCLDDKLDSYHLLITILQYRQEDLSLALTTCCKTLQLLGEDVPDDTKVNSIFQILELGRTRVSSSFISSSDMLKMPRTQCKRTSDIMRFYHQLALVSYTKGNAETGRARGLLSCYYVSRWMSYCLNKKVVCRHTCLALGCYSAILVHGFVERNCQQACRLGKIALKFLNDNEDQKELPGTYLLYYGYTAVLSEPIQACVDMHRRAYEVGMKMGNTSGASTGIALLLHSMHSPTNDPDAIFNVMLMIPRMMECGTNLLLVKKEIDFFRQLAKIHSHPIMATFMKWYQDTITLLVGNSSDVIPLVNSNECNITDATSIHLLQLMMPAVFLGQYERVLFFANKWEELQSDERNRMPLRIIRVSQYHGLGLCGLLRRGLEQGLYQRNKSNKWKKYMSAIDNSISVLTKASKFSEWNYKGKLSLLLAEKAYIQGKDGEAKGHYDAAIKEAKSSKFVHEEGLAYELSARYYEKNKTPDIEKAITLYEQAERCYIEWGSAKKANQIKEAILLLIGKK